MTLPPYFTDFWPNNVSGVAIGAAGNRQPDVLQRPEGRERLQPGQDPDADLQGKVKATNLLLSSRARSEQHWPFSLERSNFLSMLASIQADATNKFVGQQR